MNNLYLFLYFFAYHLATSGVPPVVRVPPVENHCCRTHRSSARCKRRPRTKTPHMYNESSWFHLFIMYFLTEQTDNSRQYEVPQATANEELAQGLYVADRGGGFKPTTLRTKGVESTNAH